MIATYYKCREFFEESRSFIVSVSLLSRQENAVKALYVHGNLFFMYTFVDSVIDKILGVEMTGADQPSPLLWHNYRELEFKLESVAE